MKIKLIWILIVALWILILAVVAGSARADENWVPVKQTVINQNIYGVLDGSDFYLNIMCSNNVSQSSYVMLYGDIEGVHRFWCKDGNQCQVVVKGKTQSNWWNTVDQGYEYGQIKVYYATSHDNTSCSFVTKWYSPAWSGKREYFPASVAGFDSELILMGIAGLFVGFILWDGFISAYLK